MKRYKLQKLIIILCFFLILILQCSRTPEGAFKTVDTFFQLRNQESHIQLYNLHHDNFKRDIPLDDFIKIEKVNKDRFGQVVEYKLKKWNERKNFSCGRGSGRMVALIYNTTYEKRTAEETFTMLKTGDKWEIFDYYLRPL